MWSLGTLCYELIFGIPPFYSKVKKLMMEQILYDELIFPKSPVISCYCKDFISRCLKKNPHKRLHSDRGLDHIWL